MYETGIVSFVDILGFSSLVSQRECREIAAILDKFQRFTGDDGGERHAYSPTIMSFSDSVIRIRHIEHRSNVEFPIGHLFHELIDLLHAQGELLWQGVLIRGAITVGHISVSENRIFGPAFIEAYQLESRFAVYPRIIVSPRSLHAQAVDGRLVPDHHTPEVEQGYVRSLLRQGEDGIWFIDYLRAFAGELDHPDYYPEYLSRHREAILRAGITEDTVSPLAVKYAWLATYHNSVVNELPEEWFNHYDINREELTISPSDLPILFELPLDPEE